MKKIVLLSLILLIAGGISIAQNTNDEKLDWWGDIDGFINQQDKITLDLVEEALAKYPPSLAEPLERRMAMLMLDGVLHEEQAAHRSSVQNFLHERITLSVEELQQTDVKEGAMICKLYNHGFIIRTATVTFAFDLVRAHSADADGFVIEDVLMNKLIEQCDALFISHRHGDHGDQWVAETFILQNKPVVSPPELWQDKPIYEKIIHLEREPHIMQALKIQDGRQNLNVVNYPGHQGTDIENNVSLVFTPEGMSFAQTGDQSGPESDWDWIDKIRSQYSVDVLFPNCWTPDIHRVLRGFNSKLVITGHENEMGHTIDHRESNWLTYTRLKGSEIPFLLLTWGESFHYIPGNIRQ